MDNNKIKLISLDRQEFTVELEIAIKSKTIKAWREKSKGDNVHPFPVEVHGDILRRVIEWLRFHKDDPPVSKEDDSSVKLTDDIVDWDKKFLQVDHFTLHDMNEAASWLDIGELVDVICKTFVNIMKGKSPDEIRQIFNIKNDFTPAEKEQIRQENELCKEK